MKSTSENDSTVQGRVWQGVWGHNDGRGGTLRAELTPDAMGFNGTFETTGFAGNLNATRS